MKLKLKSLINKKPKENPLVLACRAKPQSLEQIKLLLDEHPEHLQYTTKDGEVPLHIACQNGASMEIIALLYEAWPEAVQVIDHNGILPLHWACFHGATKQ